MEGLDHILKRINQLKWESDLSQIGVESITVSSFKKAFYFAQKGWTDITVALTAIIFNVPIINELSSEINLSIIVEDEETIHDLEKQIPSS